MVLEQPPGARTRARARSRRADLADRAQLLAHRHRGARRDGRRRRPYFAVLRDAFERARSSILIVGWDFDGKVVLDPLGDGPASRPLREYLPGLLERRPGLTVRILVWGLSMFYGESQGLRRCSTRAGRAIRASSSASPGIIRCSPVTIRRSCASTARWPCAAAWT
jgi:hypothetical protein